MLNPFEYHPVGNFNKFEFFMSRKILILFQELACVIMEPLGSLQMLLSCQINPQEVVSSLPSPCCAMWNGKKVCHQFLEGSTWLQILTGIEKPLTQQYN